MANKEWNAGVEKCKCGEFTEVRKDGAERCLKCGWILETCGHVSSLRYEYPELSHVDLVDFDAELAELLRD